MLNEPGDVKIYIILKRRAKLAQIKVKNILIRGKGELMYTVCSLIDIID